MLKKIALTFAVLASAVSAFAQGTVNFNNFSIAFTTATDQSRLVYVGSIASGVLAVGTQYKAQLYVGADAGSLLSVTQAFASFRSTAGPGTWAGGNRNLVTSQGTFNAGQTVMLDVRVWDFNTGATWETAVAKGSSGAFSYTIPPAGSPPSAFFLEGLRAFAVVPEPGTFALGGLGLLGLCLWRRRK